MSSWRNSLLSNIAWATGSEGLLRITRIIVLILMVRWLGPSEYGIYAFAFSLMGIYSAFLDPGISTFIQRSMAQKKVFVRWTWNIFRLKLAIVFFSGLVLVLCLPFIVYDSSRLTVTILMVLYFMCLELINTAYVILRGMNNFKYEFLIRFIFSAISSIVVILVIYLNPSALNATLSQFIIALLFSAMIIILAKNWARPFKKSLKVKIELIILRRSFPIGIVGLIAIAYANIDTILLGIYGADKDVGIYAAAIRILLILQLPTAIIGQTLFVLISKDFYLKNSLINIKWIYIYKILISLSIIGTIGVLSTGDELVLLVFGEQYIESASVLRILSFALTGFTLFPIFSQILVISGHVKIVILTTLSILVVIILVILLSPKDSQLIWVAYCMSIGHALLAISLGYFLYSKLQLQILKPFISAQVIIIFLCELTLSFIIEKLAIFGLFKIVMFIGGSIIIIIFSLVTERKFFFVSNT